MLFRVRVIPASGRQEIIKISEKEYRVYLKGCARDNRANVELVKLLKKYLKKEVRIKSGLSSRNKILEVLE